ncbi:MAG TPA: hypothetical protein VGA61_01910 [Anaerolineae bacterium]
MRPLIRVLALCLPLLGSLSAAHAEMVPGATVVAVSEAKRIDAILSQPESEMDLARIKLTIDNMIDPAVDIEAGLRQIEEMANAVRAMLRGFPPSSARLDALRMYLYEKGAWNGYRAFSYPISKPHQSVLA